MKKLAHFCGIMLAATSFMFQNPKLRELYVPN